MDVDHAAISVYSTFEFRKELGMCSNCYGRFVRNVIGGFSQDSELREFIKTGILV